MDRNRLYAGVAATILTASLLTFTPTATANTGAQPIAKDAAVEMTYAEIARGKALGGFWITVTKFPSKYGSFSDISQTVYGKADLWGKVYQANRSRVSSPNVIYVGQRLFVPVLNGTKAKPRTNTTASRSTPRSTAKWAKPLSRLTVTSCYGWRWGAMHQGTDYDGATGQRIYAVASGVVKKAGWWAGGYGISVLIRHSDGSYTHYAHMSRMAVNVGRTIRAGQVIGFVGATGDATGSHLHFEVWRGMWNQINPAPWLRARGIRTAC